MSKLYDNDSACFRKEIPPMRGTKEATLATDRYDVMIDDEDKGFSPTRKSEMARLRKK